MPEAEEEEEEDEDEIRLYQLHQTVSPSNLSGFRPRHTVVVLRWTCVGGETRLD